MKAFLRIDIHTIMMITQQGTSFLAFARIAITDTLVY